MQSLENALGNKPGHATPREVEFAEVGQGEEAMVARGLLNETVQISHPCIPSPPCDTPPPTPFVTTNRAVGAGSWSQKRQGWRAASTRDGVSGKLSNHTPVASWTAAITAGA